LTLAAPNQKAKGTYLDLLADKQALHDLPVVLCQACVVQPDPKLQAVAQRGVPHASQRVLQHMTDNRSTLSETMGPNSSQNSSPAKISHLVVVGLNGTGASI
jgi:hypothetical protein